jgi:hypothetical protein
MTSGRGADAVDFVDRAVQMWNAGGAAGVVRKPA